MLINVMENCNIKNIYKWIKMAIIPLFGGYCIFFVTFFGERLTSNFQTFYNGKKGQYAICKTASIDFAHTNCA